MQEFLKEMATSAPEQRNWKGICLALLVILIICSLVVTAVILISPVKENFSNRTRLRLQEVLSGKFSYRRANATWISGHELIYRDMYGALVLYNALENVTRVITSNNTFRQHKVEDYSMSRDRRYLLLTLSKKKIHSYTYKARYLIYAIANHNAQHSSISRVLLTEIYFVYKYRMAKELHPRGKERARLQYARWGNEGSQLMYIYRNNIYYAVNVKQALNKNEIQLTQDGNVGVYFNGIPDWLYEEEIFKSNNAVWWSPKGDYLCYASINDSKVQSMVYPIYGPFSDPNNLYPRLEALRYPKPGTKNPIIKLWVVDLKNNLKIPREIFPPSQIRNQEHYVTSVSWIDNTRLSVIWITRSQNLSVIGECILNKQQCFTVIYSNYYTDCISQRSKENAPGGPEGKAWVEMFDPPVHGAYKYYLRLPIANSRSGYFQHIAKLKFMENRKQFLTRGEYEVTKIISFDRETETLFYIANRVGKAGERHLYSVADHRFTNHHEPKCLTCDIGNECLYNDAKFSPNHKYYILECLGPGVPYSALYRIHNNTFVKLLDQNDEVRNFVAYRAMPQNRTFLVPLPSKFSNGCCPFISSSELFERLMPRSIPWLSRRYGGPGTQNVKEEFKVDWSTYLTTYWGWAYGGYVVTRAMTSPYGNSFQCGIAVAPVTSWLYQDSFYTERYMQTFEENRIGYLDADALLGAADLKDKKFLLIHGSADDHVHFQQSMMLAMALNSNGVMYRSQFYPDESHDLAGVKEHLYRTMGGFLDECFEQSEMDFYS
ncbi:Inactive dipeptidyl peptidase 10 [Nymphon striatum]|nr:Inactive dipeptidyl peptidase 10 [Nymphon striatum]